MQDDSDDSSSSTSSLSSQSDKDQNDFGPVILSMDERRIISINFGDAICYLPELLVQRRNARCNSTNAVTCESEQRSDRVFRPVTVSPIDETIVNAVDARSKEDMMQVDHPPVTIIIADSRMSQCAFDCLMFAYTQTNADRSEAPSKVLKQDEFDSMMHNLPLDADEPEHDVFTGESIRSLQHHIN